MRHGKRYVQTNRRKHPHFLTSFSILVAEGQSAGASAGGEGGGGDGRKGEVIFFENLFVSMAIAFCSGTA